MFLRTFAADSFVRLLSATEPLAQYCRTRNIPLGSASSRPRSLGWWREALAQLPSDVQNQVESELAMVNELSGNDGTDHLVAAAGSMLPPPEVPAGPATALWFLLNQPALFHEVFFHHEIVDVDAWRTGKTVPGVAIDDLEERALRLRDSLRMFFHIREGTEQFSSCEGRKLPKAYGFLVRFADRQRFIEGFTDAGKTTVQRLRPALPFLFVYYPRTGTVLLRSHLRAADRIAGLLRCFGEAALGVPVEYVHDAFDLNRLKFPFHPLPDADDIETVRVKSLHLRYPQRSGRRVVKLETRTNDEPMAIEHLLRTHVPPTDLGQLEVSHAELQLRTRFNGRGRNYLIRLWPNRCSLAENSTGDHFRSCLQKWGLCHARQH